MARGQGGQGAADPVEGAWRAALGRGLGASFLGLLGLPGVGLRRRGCDMAVFEDVGMAAHHLGHGAGGDSIEIETPGFARHLRVKHHLKQQIAQFVEQGWPVLVVNRVGDFVGLLDGVGRDGGEGLRHVPGTAALRVT